MAFDLALGITPKNWSRGTAIGPPIDVPMEPAVEITSKEKLELERLASVKMRAESGDKKAKIQWKRMSSKISSLAAKAKAGDPKAKRSLLVLKQNGFFQPILKFDMSGDDMSDLNQRSKKGDISAQIALRKLKIRKAADEEELSLGSLALLGSFAGAANHEDIEAAMDGGSCERDALVRQLGWNPFKVSGSGYKMAGTSKDGTYVEWEAPFIDSAGMMAPESARPVSGISWQPI
jgi:hypothetical protein